MFPDCIKRTNAKWTVFAGARKARQWFKFSWRLLGTLWIRLLNQFVCWKNFWIGKTVSQVVQKKIDGDISFFKDKNALSQNYPDKTKWIAPSFFYWSQSLKVLFFCCSQLQERQFCEISVVPIQEQTERVGWFQDSFSPVSFSGFSSQHSPPIKGFVWLLIPSPTPPPICPRIWSKPLGKRTKVEWGWWAQAGKVRRQARQKCLQRWQRQKWDQTSRGKVPAKMKLFWWFRHMRTGDQAFGKSS